MNIKEQLSKATQRFALFFSPVEERHAFFENLSLLVQSGTPLIEGLRIVEGEFKSARLKRVVAEITEALDGGGKFYSALTAYPTIFTDYEVRMVKVAEETGKMGKTLQYLADQLEKDLELRGKIRTALLYPVIVLVFAGVIGIGIAWFVLPKLARVFASLRIKLPLVTKILIGLGEFINNYGGIVFPVFIAVAIAVFMAFRFTRLRFFGLWFAEHMPSIGPFLREVRTARICLFFGTLLEAGVPILETLQTMENISEASNERRFFKALKGSIEIGGSFQTSFAVIKESKTLFPSIAQHMIFTAEKSGKLPDIFLYIATLYERKIDGAAKNLTQTLEPVLLVGIAGVVAFLAIAIILPIYSLVGGFQEGGVVQQTPVAEAPVSAPQPEALAPVAPLVREAPAPATPQLKILESPLGFVNVRSGPGVNYKKLREAKPGEVYEYTTKESGWYRIVDANGTAGWISEQYAQQL